MKSTHSYAGPYGPNGEAIWKIDPGGILHLVAGGRNTAEGAPAQDASVFGTAALAVSTRGEIYFMDAQLMRIRKIGTNGLVTTVAGGGTVAQPPDGILATDAEFDFGFPSQGTYGLTIGPDQAIYFSDSRNNRIRKLTADGRVVTVAGGGPAGANTDATGHVGDDGSARAAWLHSPSSIDFGADGTMYFIDLCNAEIRKVGPDGMIHKVVQTGTSCLFGTTSPARGLVVTADQDLLVANASAIDRFHTDGTFLGHVAGGAGLGCADAECAAQNIQVTPVVSFARAPDNTYWAAGGWTNAGVEIWQLISNFPLTTALPTDIVLASQDAGEIYVFDGRGRHKRTQDALAGAITQSFSYDDAGYLTAVADRAGNTTTIERDASEHPLSITSPFGQRTTLGLNGDGYLSSITDPANESWSMNYQPGGLLASLTDARQGLHFFAYDSNGFLKSDVGPTGVAVSLDRHGALAPDRVTQTSSLGRVTEYDVASSIDGSQTVSRTDSAGLTTTAVQGADFSFTTTTPDGMASHVQRKTDDRFSISNASYAGSWTTATPGGVSLSGSSTQAVTLSDPTDPLTLTRLIESTTVNGRTSQSSYVANASGGTVTFTSAASRTATMALDNLGRVSSVSAPGVLPMQFHYDAKGRNDTVTQGDRVTTLGFAASGFVNSVTDPMGHVVTLATDPVGRPTLATQPDATTIGVSYDPNGNVTGVTPPGRPEHDFSYDLADEETQYTPPDAGVPMSTVTSYNLDEQVSLVTRPDGDTILPGYDATSGRLRTLTTAAGVTTFGYNPDGGQLSSIAAPGESLAYGYDGALLKDVTWSGSVAGNVHREYDNSFRIKSETVGGTTINYTYDNDDLLIQAGDLAIPRDAATGFVSAGATLGALQESNAYDAYGALQTYTVTSGAHTLYAVNYGTRDRLGRLVDKTETVSGQTHSYHYGYDLNGRLVDVFNDGVAPGSAAWDSSTTYPSGALVSFGMVEYQSLRNGNLNQPPNISPASWSVWHAYAYDPNGNRLVAPGLTASPSYDVQDRLISYGSCTYGYKRDGSLQAKTCPEGTTTYDYDALGNLRNVGLPNGTAIDYVIDGQNRRVGKKVNSLLVEGFLYRSQLQPAAWLNGDGSIKAIFVYGLKPNVPEYMIKGGLKYRLVTDQLGSVRLVVDPNGNIIERIDYDEFGNVLGDTAPGTQPFGFVGGLRDTDTGLTRFGARDYDRVTARWTTKDALRFGGDDSNLYSYCDSDPLNHFDPDGHDWLDWNLQPYGDFLTGMADAASLGLGPLARAAWDSYFDDNLSTQVDECSTAYKFGTWASLAIGTGRAAYAGLAKAGAMAAASGAEASAFRQGLKSVFRLGLARGFRSPNMAKYVTDEALREAAGRTNALINAIGLDFAIGGAIDAGTRKCGCEQF